MGSTMKVRGISCGRALFLLLAVWLGFLLLAVSLLRHEPDPQVNQRISQALRDLQSLHQQRHEINKLIYEYSLGSSGMKQEERSAFLKNLRDKVKEPVHSKGYDDTFDCKDGPPTEYEKVRRRLKSGVDEMWYYMNAELKKLHKEASLVSPQFAAKINKVIQGGVEHKRSLIRDVTMLPKVDGYAKWREREATELSDLVQRRLKTLQTPSDCPKARKLVCNLNKGCGYGCQLHHATYCLLVAYGTERSLILKSKGWRYNRAGWEKVFKPASDTCVDTNGIQTVNWPGNSNSQVVMLGIVDSVLPRPPYLPLAVPKDLAPRIARLHGDPSVWWVGQFLKYLLRPQEDTIALLDNAAAKFNFKGPVVGVHIRRTDKVGTEAAFHTVDEYMAEVEEYFKQLALSQRVEKKRIYLASDDPKVFAEVQKNYWDYEVFGDPQVAKTAAVATRYTDNSLNGIIMDIHFLSKSDFLVCTFSSQVCRVAYEIMQSLHVDAADKFRSLDDIYYYGGQGVHRKIAILPHKADAPDQIDLEVGDTVGVAGNHWNGYSKGKNLRTNQVGLYPTFKKWIEQNKNFTGTSTADAQDTDLAFPDNLAVMVQELEALIELHKNEFISVLMLTADYTWVRASEFMTTFMHQFKTVGLSYKMDPAYFSLHRIPILTMDDFWWTGIKLALSIYSSSFVNILTTKKHLPFFLLLKNWFQQLGLGSGIILLLSKEVEVNQKFCAFVISGDADVDLAVDTLCRSFTHSPGGVRVSAVYVEQPVHAHAVNLIRNRMSQIAHGPPENKRTELLLKDSPVNNKPLEVWSACTGSPVHFLFGWDPADTNMADDFPLNDGYLSVLPYRNLSDLKLFLKKSSSLIFNTYISFWSEKISAIKMQSEFQFSHLWINCLGVWNLSVPFISLASSIELKSGTGNPIWYNEIKSTLGNAMRGFAALKNLNMEQIEFLLKSVEDSDCKHKYSSWRNYVMRRFPDNFIRSDKCMVVESRNYHPYGVVLIKFDSIDIKSMMRIVAGALLCGNAIILLNVEDTSPFNEFVDRLPANTIHFLTSNKCVLTGLIDSIVKYESNSSFVKYVVFVSTLDKIVKNEVSCNIFLTKSTDNNSLIETFNYATNVFIS